MQKRSHTLLASSLLKSGNGFPARRYEWAFLFGSFQPDCNPLSYLKGSLRCRPLGGHTYANSQTYIFSHIRRLQHRSRWTLWQYYTLGKLTHYLADAFTYPHNDHYPDTLLSHHQYETDLRLCLADYLSSHTLCPRQRRGDVAAAIRELHDQYASARTDQKRDVEYILAATGLLMAGCVPAGTLSL